MSKDISRHLKFMLQTIQHRGPDGSGVIIGNKAIYGNIRDMDLPRGHIGIGHNRLRIVREALQPIPNEDYSLWIAHNGEVYNSSEVRKELERHTFRTNMDSEILLHTYEENKLELVNGDYAFAVYDVNDERLEIFRDPIGVKPLFFCFENRIFAFASERKALSKICSSPQRLSPGHKIIIERDGLTIEKFQSIDDLKLVKIKNEAEAIELLKKSLEIAVERRLYKPVGILFSGGIDSSIVAKIASQYEDIILITTGIRGSRDIIRAKNVAEKMNIDIHEVIIDEKELVDLFKNVINIIDEPDPLKALIGIPIYVAAKYAKEQGIRVIMAGQGADELFGGYARYLQIKDIKDLERVLLEDIRSLHEKNLERDDHCTMSNSVELRVPYLDINVVKIALSIPVTYKIRNNIRKWILRKVGEHLHLPKEAIHAEKKAIQYGSGVVGILKKYAKKRKLTLRELAQKFFMEGRG